MHRLEHLVAHTLDCAYVWVERRSDVGVIRLLHRAPAPATHCVLCAPMRRAVWRALRHLEQDTRCRIILITSDSARVFAQGPCYADMNDALYHSPSASSMHSAHGHGTITNTAATPTDNYTPSLAELTRAIEQSAKVTIAVVEGLCVSWGLELALAARWCVAVTSDRSSPTSIRRIIPNANKDAGNDNSTVCGGLVNGDTNNRCDDNDPAGLASSKPDSDTVDDDHTRFCFPEVKLQVVTCGGGAQRLVRRVGVRRALDLLMSGRTVSAREAHAMHMIDAVLTRTHRLSSRRPGACTDGGEDGCVASADAMTTTAYTMMLTRVLPEIMKCLPPMRLVHGTNSDCATSDTINSNTSMHDDDDSGSGDSGSGVNDAAAVEQVQDVALQHAVLSDKPSTHTGSIMSHDSMPPAAATAHAVAWWKRPFQAVYLAWVKHGLHATRTRSSAHGALYAVDSVSLALRQSAHTATRAVAMDRQIRECTALQRPKHTFMYQDEDERCQPQQQLQASHCRMDEEQALFRACAARPEAACAHYLFASAQDLTRWRDEMAQQAAYTPQEQQQCSLLDNIHCHTSTMTATAITITTDKRMTTDYYTNDSSANRVVGAMGTGQSVVCLTPPTLWTPRQVVLFVRSECDGASDRAQWAQMLRCRLPASTSVTVLCISPMGLCQIDTCAPLVKTKVIECVVGDTVSNTQGRRSAPHDYTNSSRTSSSSSSNRRNYNYNVNDMRTDSDCVARVLCGADVVFDCANVMTRALQCEESHCAALVRTAERVCALSCLYILVNPSCSVEPGNTCASAGDAATGRLRVLAVQWSTPYWSSPIAEVFVPPTTTTVQRSATRATDVAAMHIDNSPTGMSTGQTLARAMALLQQLRKQAVLIVCASPPDRRYALPRLPVVGAPSLLWRMLLAGLFQVYSLLMDGCYPHEIDRTLRDRAGFARGLLAMEDALGLEVVAQVRAALTSTWTCPASDEADISGHRQNMSVLRGQDKDDRDNRRTNNDIGRNAAIDDTSYVRHADDARAESHRNDTVTLGERILYNLHDPDNQHRESNTPGVCYYLRLSHLAYDVWRAQVQAQRVGCTVGHGWHLYHRKSKAAATATRAEHDESPHAETLVDADRTCQSMSVRTCDGGIAASAGETLLRHWNPMMWDCPPSPCVSHEAALHSAHHHPRRNAVADDDVVVEDVRCECGEVKEKPEHSDVVDACVRHCSAACGIYRRDCSDKEVMERVMLAMLNEACEALARGEVRGAGDVDCLAVLGLGLPAHKGGLCCWVDRVIGIDEAIHRMRIYNRSFGPAVFPAPNAVMLAMQRDKSTFHQTFPASACGW